LLKAIEDTISSLCYDRRLYKTLASIAREASESIRNSPKDNALDTNGEVGKKLLRAQQLTRDFHDILMKKRQLAISDPQLTDEDGVADEYAQTIQIVVEVHNAINSLRWSISEHDADVRSKDGTKSKTYPAEDIEKLIADLNAHDAPSAFLRRTPY
jgi:hypothetical protein